MCRKPEDDGSIGLLSELEGQAVLRFPAGPGHKKFMVHLTDTTTSAEIIIDLGSA